MKNKLVICCVLALGLIGFTFYKFAGRAIGVYHGNYNPHTAKLYASHLLTNTAYLVYRDTPALVNQYVIRGNDRPLKVLDYGCGAGKSTRFLKSLGFQMDVDGIDINEHMLSLARSSDPKGNYAKVANDRTLLKDNTYDLVYSTLMLFELGSRDELRKVLSEMQRVMKSDGVLIAVTGSTELYNPKHRWVSVNADFPQNYTEYKSGEMARVDVSMDQGVMSFLDYYWTENDYRQAFNEAGLNLVTILRPLGTPEEENELPWKWKDEMLAAPFVVFVLTKGV